MTDRHSAPSATPQTAPKPETTTGETAVTATNIDQDRLLATTDAAVWAEEFQKLVANGVEIDEGLMIGWFSSAMAVAMSADATPENAPKPAKPDVTVFLGEKVKQVTWVESFGWTCERCGWLALGLLSVNAAMQEAHDHIKTHHPELKTVEVVRRA